MFELALKAGFPVIGVRTDDVLNFPEALKLLSKKKPVAFTGANNLDDPDTILWVEHTGSDALKHLTYAYAANLKKKSKQLIVVNPLENSSAMFNAGTFTVPKALITTYLRDVLETKFVDSIYMALKGLSLRSVNEIVLLTQARTGAHTLKELRRTRSMLSGGVQGLTPMDTDYDFYLFPEKLDTWLKLQKPYFLSPKTPNKLRPRGLLLDGSAGVGKSMAAKAIAKTWDLPLYRIDVAASLSRWVGESEARIGQSLQLVEKESPCVLPQTKVRTTVGEIAAEEIYHRQSTENFYLKGIDPLTEQPCVIKMHTMLKKKGKPSVKIHTSTGSLSCTENHKLLCRRETTLVWVEAKDLKEGDDLVEVL